VSSEAEPLRRLADALHGALGDGRALRSVLAAHPAASDLLLDALLANGPDGLAPEADPHAAPAAPAADEHRLGPYRIERELGRGGQAVVYAATDTRLGRRVALKVLQADRFRSHRSEQRFRAEAATTSRLDHPGICPVYDVGEAGDAIYLAMRLVEGRTLAQCIQTGIQTARGKGAPGQPLDLQLGGDAGARTWQRTLRLFETIAAALHAAHAAGVTHRDVKPGNVMVQADGSAVVLDFGLAADRNRDGATLTRTGDVFGTPAYMAPEQCRGEAGDHRVDVWALGASLFEALTGNRAFPGETPEATMRAILTGVAPRLGRHARPLPRELGVVLGKAMDPDPARRYADAAGFAADLRAVRELRPILATPPSLALRVRRWTQRNPWPTTLLAVVLVTGAITTWLGVRQGAAGRENRLLRLPAELQALAAEYPGLVPVVAHRDAAEAWCTRARAFATCGTDVRLLLIELRRRGQPVAGALRGNGPELQRELARLTAIDTSLALGLARDDVLAEQRAPAAAAAREAARTALRERIAALGVWQFPTAADQQVHDVCVQLLADLDAFTGEAGPLAAAERELLASAEAAVSWDEVIADIAADPRFGGLRLVPQHGLQPLRRSTATGLWEFAHLRSGPPPRVQPDGSYEFADDSGIVLVLLPGGRTTIGAQRSDPAGRRYVANLRVTELLLVDVPLDPFFVAMHETTRAQWTRLGGRDRSFWPVGWQGTTERHPVDEVGWDAAVDVLARSGLTLPTEAQWEYAARAAEHREQELPIDGAGARLPENLFDATAVRRGMTSLATALAGDDGFPCTAPVGSFAANGFGLHDLRGNVQEWCLDEAGLPDRDVLEAGTGAWLAPPNGKHPLRGHCWLNDLKLSPLSTRTLTSGTEKDRGCRAARALER
jgi:serine/threonine protein kinase/formylglycine-generating enzyme required for sulfatase activity